MGLLDIFTGDAYKEAAEKQRQYLQGVQNQTNARLAGAQGTGLEALTSGRGSALDAITAAFGTGRGDIDAATANALNALYGYGDRAAGALTGGLADLRSAVETARGDYGPLAAAAGRYGTLGGGAGTMLANALGTGGPEGQAAARAAFQAGPGYEFAVNQGLESILRNANAAGMAAGGNQLREAQTFGQGLANQEFQTWLKNLQAQAGLYSPLEQSALSTAAGGRAQAALTGGTGAANLSAALANLLSGTGKSAADVISTGGRSLADLVSKGGLASADIYGKTGTNIADLVSRLATTGTQAATQLAPTYSGTYGTEAAAETGGSANLWNLLGGLASFGAGGGISKLGSIPGQVKGLFG